MRTPLPSLAPALLVTILASNMAVAAETTPPPTPAAPAQEQVSLAPVKEDYSVVMVPASETNWYAIRYHLHTGKAWRLSEGAWVEIKDAMQPPRSDYRIQMVPLKDDWGALRYDVHTGQSWIAQENAWSAVRDMPVSPAE
ncbi:MAG TPA: hypothetical protein VEL28_05125 [Candidatus Binatia bacterium]|nr:hypothetical protein [Candidatus Binatia bacterium]